MKKIFGKSKYGKWRCAAVAVLAIPICMAASPRVADAGPPIGINVGWPTDWNGDWIFADAQKQGRQWMDTTHTWLTNVDSNGWPQQDAIDGVFYGVLNNVNMAGTYGLSFNGQATIAVTNGSATISNQSYNSSTNTTTATITDGGSNTSNLELTFTSTKRTSGSGTNTGITNVQIMRPTAEGGNTPIAFGTLFYPPYLTLISNFGTIRFMQYASSWGSPVVNWSDRTIPGWESQSHHLGNVSGNLATGGSWEYAIELCNAANRDMWVNVPHKATADYITKLAELIKYGSDGVNPYTSTQANPVYPPLNANLNCYVEWGNEVWNGGAPGDSDYADNTAAATAEAAAYPVVGGKPAGPLTFDGTTASEAQFRVAEQTVAVSNSFRAIFGDSAMPGTSANPRIRPVLESQFGWADNYLLQGCHMMEDYYNNPAMLAAEPGPITTAHAPSYYVYGAGGSDYYTPGFGTGLTISNIWTSGDFNLTAHVPLLTGDVNYVLPMFGHRVAYEGGPNMPKQNTGDDAICLAAWSDARMTTLVENQQTEWSQYGDGLLVYFWDVGDYQFGFVTDLNTQNTMKMAAVSAINSGAAAAGTYGTPIPSTILASAYNDPPSWAGANPSSMVASSASTWLNYTVNVGTAGAVNIGLSSGSSGTTNQADIYVDGALAGTITIPNTGSNTTYANSGTIPTPSLTVGTHGILVKAKTGSFGVYTLQITSGSPTIPPAPTGLTGTAGYKQVALVWNTSVGSTSYNVYRGTTAGGESGTAIVTGIIPASYTDTGLTNGTAYYYTVKAVNSAGTSGASNEASATPIDNTAHVVQTATAPTIDGTVDAVWSNAPTYSLGHVTTGSTTDTGTFQMLWDSTNLYVLATVNDSTLVKDTTSVWNGDTVEVYIDGDDNKSTSYDSNDFQYAFQYNNATATESKHSPGSLTGVVFAQGNFSGGYRMEIKIPWTTIGVTPSANNLIGTDVMLDDCVTSGSRAGKRAWWATVDNTWNDPALMGNGLLVAGGTSGLVKINTGGPAVSPFVADADFSGGTVATNWTGTIDTSAVTSPAPQAVYQSERYGSPMTYTMGGLTPNASYTVRLHFCENYWSAAGQRTFAVAINNTNVLTNFDIFATTGAQHKANIQQFTAAANASGQIVIAFTNVVDHALINGIEINALAAPAPPAGLTATPGNAQVALSWTASSGATSYNVLRSTVSGSGYASVATGISTTTYTNTGLTNGTAYYFVVTATNSGGTSGNSNQASATPTTNLILNPGYETGSISSWVANGTCGVSTTAPHAGSYCGYEAGGWAHLTQTINNLLPSHAYTVTVWAKLSASTSSSITITANGYNNGSGSGSTSVTSTSWTQYTLHFTTGTTNLSSTSIGVWDNNGTAITCYVDDWTLN